MYSADIVAMIEATVLILKTNGGRQVTEKAFTSKLKKGDVGMARRFSKVRKQGMNYQLRVKMPVST